MTVKLTLPPTITDCEAGWEVIDGATGAGVTVRVAFALVTLPAMLPTTTL